MNLIEFISDSVKESALVPEYPIYNLKVLPLSKLQSSTFTVKFPNSSQVSNYISEGSIVTTSLSLSFAGSVPAFSSSSKARSKVIVTSADGL